MCLTLISAYCNTNERYKYEFYEYIDKLIYSTMTTINKTGEDDEQTED